MICANCEYSGISPCTHQHLTEECVKCGHEDMNHDFDDKGECLICDCDGLET